jgi:hypothetical protein
MTDTNEEVGENVYAVSRHDDSEVAAMRVRSTFELVGSTRISFINLNYTSESREK